MTGHRCPTCGGLPPAWGPAQIVAAINRWVAEHDGRPPTADQWVRSTPRNPANTTVLVVFGSWNNGLRAAGQKPVKPGGRRHGQWTRESMIAALFEWRFAQGRLPGFRDWATREEGRPTSSQAQRLFGSWNAFLVAGGYEPAVLRRPIVGYQRQAGAATRRLALTEATR